jgi:alpha-glucosidase (family GH31 glycosyl hydrolase)
MKEIIKQEMLMKLGVSGWMADFAEYLPFDALLYNASIDAASYHNLYPEEWAKLNQEAVQEYFIEENNEKGKSINIENDIYYFLRSGWLQSPLYARGFWLGDQMVSWDEHDGFKSAILGALTGGLTGHSLTHTDIGGYTIQERGGPFPIYVRSEELLLRWIEFASFGNSIFRSHMGLSISQKNAQVFSSPRIIAHFNLFTHLFAYLAKYRKQLMKEASEKGWPLIRIMAAHYAYDPITWELTQQYMFGSEFLIAPVVDPGTVAAKKNIATTVSGASAAAGSSKDEVFNSPVFNDLPIATVRVYIPAYSTFIHLWSGQKVVTGAEGVYLAVDAPIGAPPVFFEVHSTHGWELFEYVRTLNMTVSVSGITVISIEGNADCSFATTAAPTTSSSSKTTSKPPVDSDSTSSKIEWGGMMRKLKIYKAPDWYDWLGIADYVSSSNMDTLSVKDDLSNSSLDYQSSATTSSSSAPAPAAPVMFEILSCPPTSSLP